MNKKIFVVMFVLVMAFGASAHAGEIPPPLRDIVVSASISYDTGGIYTYSYSVYNPSSNASQIRMIQIDISKPDGTASLNSEGFIIEGGYNKNRRQIRTSTFSEDASLKRMENSVIPVGVKMGDNYWGGGISAMGTVLWGSSSEETRILPGAELGGFEITSYGLPGLRDVKVKPAYIATEEEAIAYAGSEEEYINNDKGVLDKLYDSITYKGRTLGPTAPPAVLVPKDFVDSIISMKHEAYSLGWITSQGVETSLDAKLDNAKKKLEQGNNNAAKQVLEAFINEVEAQGCATYDDCPEGKHLKPEAYALLKYNAKYLIDNLK